MDPLQNWFWYMDPIHMHLWLHKDPTTSWQIYLTLTCQQRRTRISLAPYFDLKFSYCPTSLPPTLNRISLTYVLCTNLSTPNIGPGWPNPVLPVPNPIMPHSHSTPTSLSLLPQAIPFTTCCCGVHRRTTSIFPHLWNLCHLSQ
jgi:hypothetical protein